MLVEFTAENFRSYKEKMVFSMEAVDEDYRKDNIIDVKLDDGSVLHLLKFSGIFGPNASGKSNVVHAFSALRHLVLFSRTFGSNDSMPGYEPFLLRRNAIQIPTTFTVKFVVDGKLLFYKVTYKLSRVCEETLDWLYKGDTINLIDRKVTFERDDESKLGYNQQIEVSDAIFEFKRMLNNGSYDLIPLRNRLLLSLAGNMTHNELTSAFKFFLYSLSEAVSSDIDLGDSNKETAQVVNDRRVLRIRLIKLLSIADLGISDVRLVRNTQRSFKLPTSIPKKKRQQIMEENAWGVIMRHYNETEHSQAFDIDYESAGTRHLFDLGARVLIALERGGVLFVDEMNLALHPELFKMLVRMFQHPKSNKKNAQLIFTTHDTSITNKGFMRADQIWFSQKSKVGESELYSAIDFDDVSINSPFESWYRLGRFGAQPRIIDPIEAIFDDVES